MPPIAMWSSVTRTISRACVSSKRFQQRKSSRRSIGCGNLGAWPNPPWRASNARTRPFDAWRKSETSSSPSSVSSRPKSCKCPVICAAASLTSARRAAPHFGDVQEQPFETRPPVAVVRREIGAARERLQVRRQKHRHRPTALARQHLHRGHVNLIEVGPLLAIDLDADEVLIEDFGDLFILETLVLHDVTPMARRVADAEEDRPVELPGALECLGPPGIPVHGVMGMLPQVRAGFVKEAVGERGLLGHGAAPGGAIVLPLAIV